jgi:TP901 family phage tail tape measure protein
MIVGYEVGALFRVLDEASPGLRKILESVRELNKAITATRDNLKGLGASGGLAGAIGETDALAAAWTNVGAQAAAAARVVAASARSAAAAAATSVPGVAQSARGAAAAVGGGGGFRPGIGGAHITGPGVALPGGSHFRPGGTPGMVGAGVGAFSIFEASGMERGVAGLKYHLGIDNKDTTRDAEIRTIIEQGMISTGKDLNEVVEAATDAARLMRDTPGFDVAKEMPRLLRAAQTESLSKGNSLKESMKSIIGLAHMVRAYKPGEIEKLLQVFAYYSTANPAGLPTMEKTLGYAIPILQSGADIDPKDVMALSTVLATSGVTSSKAGTWLREFGVRAMPGNAKHNELLTRLGLLDAEGKPTWYTNGKPDLPKALSIAGPRAAAMPPEERLPLEMELFGRRGGGGFAVLGGDVALQRYKDLRAGQENPANTARYNAFNDAMMGTTRGVARSTLQEFNVSMIELGTTVLPSVTRALQDFTGVLRGLRALIPGTSDADKGRTGANAMEGALLGWGVGKYFGQPMLGAAAGGAIGLGAGKLNEGVDAIPKLLNKGVDALIPNFLKEPPAPPKVVFPPITLNLNVDGRQLAQTTVEQMESLTEHATGAPAANGLSHFGRADGGITAQ